MNDYKVLIDQYEILEEIGRGGSAHVVKAYDRKSGTEKAIKVISKSWMVENDMTDRIIQERDIHTSLGAKSPYIVSLETSWEDEQNIYLVLELCNGGDLASYLRQDPKGRLSNKVAAEWMHQLALGISFLHNTCRVLHRDLKLSNMLLHHNKNRNTTTVKISDFGLAVQLQEVAEEHYTFCGTPNFIAPEVLQQEISHGFPADVWSFGCTLFAVLTGESPFQGCKVSETLNNVLEENRRPTPSFVSPEARDLIEAILQSDPKSRPTIKQVLGHPFFTKSSSFSSPRTPKLLSRRKRISRRRSSPGVQLMPLASSGYSASEDEDNTEVGKRQRETVLLLRKTNSCLASFPSEYKHGNVDSTATVDIDEEIRQIEDEEPQSLEVVPSTVKTEAVPAVTILATVDANDAALYRSLVKGHHDEAKEEEHHVMQVKCSMFISENNYFELPTAIFEVVDGNARVVLSLVEKTMIVNTEFLDVINLSVPWSIALENIDPYKSPLLPHVSWLVSMGQLLFSKCIAIDEAAFRANPFNEDNKQQQLHEALSLPQIFIDRVGKSCKSLSKQQLLSLPKLDLVEDSNAIHDDIVKASDSNRVVIYQDKEGCSGYVDDTGQLCISFDTGERIELDRIGSNVRVTVNNNVELYDLAVPVDLPVRVLSLLVKVKSFIKAYDVAQAELLKTPC